MLAPESFATLPVVDRSAAPELAAVGYKASHALSELHTFVNFGFLHCPAPCCGIEIHCLRFDYFSKRSQAPPPRCRLGSLEPSGLHG